MRQICIDNSGEMALFQYAICTTSISRNDRNNPLLYMRF